MVSKKGRIFKVKPQFVQRIYQVPATHILPKSAAKEYQKLLVPNKEFSANHIARKIARITKDTINYDFKDSLAHPVYRKERSIQEAYRVRMLDKHPTMKGVCEHGSRLGIELIKGLNIVRAKAHYINTSIPKEVHKLEHYDKPIPHAVIGFETPNGYRLINTVSALSDVGLINHAKDLRRLGKVTTKKKLLQRLTFEHPGLDSRLTMGYPNERIRLRAPKNPRLKVYPNSGVNFSTPDCSPNSGVWSKLLKPMRLRKYEFIVKNVAAKRFRRVPKTV